MIKINNLFKIYNEGKINQFCALDDINLSVSKGELVILKGVSGSGKSTLLSIIGALAKPSSGEVLINGQNICKFPDILSSEYRRAQVGFIFQSFNLMDALSVEQNVFAPLALSKFSRLKTDELILNALNLANIAHKKDQLISNLSGGEKQRCAIARALIMDPPIILADEPTANLDRENSLNFIDSLSKFKELKKTILVATHDTLFDGLSIADRYVNIANAKIVS